MSIINLVTNPSGEATAGTVVVRTNRATNPALDAATTGLYSNNGNLYPVTRDAAGPIHGDGSAVSTRTGALSNVAASVFLTGIGGVASLPVTPGESLAVSVAVRAEQAGRHVAPPGLYFRDAGGVPIASSVTSETENVAVGGVTARVGAAVTVPPNAATAYLVAQAYTTDGSDAVAGERVWFDDILVEDAPVLGTYFAGDTAAAGDFTYAWTGTAHASTSQQSAPVPVGWDSHGSLSTVWQTVTDLEPGQTAAVAARHSTFTSDIRAAWTASQSLPAAAGQTVTLAAMVRTEAARQVRIQPRFATSATGSGGASPLPGTDVAVPADSWTEVRKAFVVPAGFTHVAPLVIVAGSSPGEVAGVDRMLVVVRAVAYTGPIFDGDTYNSSNFTYAWDSTPHASTSTQLARTSTVPLGTANYVLETHLRSGEYVATLPYRNIQFERFLNRPGGCRFNVPLHHEVISRSTLDPGLHEIWMYRNDNLIYVGPLWDTTPVSGEASISCGASSLEDYLDVRRINLDGTFTDDQSELAWDLIEDTQARTDGNLFLTRGVIQLGVQRQVVWNTYDGTYILEAITDVSEKEDGFDFEITPDRAFHAYFPRPQRDQGLVLSYPETIRGYSVNLMGKYLRNDILAQGPSPLFEVAIDTVSRAQYGLREFVYSLKDVDTTAQLVEHAGRVRDIRKDPRFVYNIQINTDLIDAFDPNILRFGDLVTLQIEDGYIDTTSKFRFVGMQTTVSKQGSESVTLYMNDLREVV